MSLVEAGMEVTAWLAEQSAQCLLALCHVLATPLLQQHSSSSAPPSSYQFHLIPLPTDPLAKHTALTNTQTSVAPSRVSSRCCALSPTICSSLLRLFPDTTVFLPTSRIKDTQSFCDTVCQCGIKKKKNNPSTLSKSHSLGRPFSSSSSVVARMRKRLLHTVAQSIRILTDLYGGAEFKELVMFIPGGK